MGKGIRKCIYCTTTFNGDDGIRSRIITKDAEYNLCPNCLCINIAEGTLPYLEGDGISEISEQNGAITFLDGKLDSPNKYVLTDGEFRRMMSRQLLPQEYLALRKTHDVNEYYIHDDFYDTDTGMAIQPMFEEQYDAECEYSQYYDIVSADTPGAIPLSNEIYGKAPEGHRYLLNLTFYAGSDDPEDTDTGLFELVSKEPVTKAYLVKELARVNEMLSWNDTDECPEPFVTYDTYGLNIDTLMLGLAYYADIRSRKLKEGEPTNTFEDTFILEQWQ